MIAKDALSIQQALKLTGAADDALEAEERTSRFAAALLRMREDPQEVARINRMIEATDQAAAAATTRRPSDDSTASAHPQPAPIATGSAEPPATPWETLTGRERAVAALTAQALTNQQIANRLGISPHTVNNHLRQIFRKLSLTSRVGLSRIVKQAASQHT